MASSLSTTDDVTPEGFLTGQLLIAMPAMADPRFQQSVIYMCAHTPEGAMGLVLNRPIVKPTFDDLLKQLSVEPLPPVRQVKLCAGGPVENARGFVLHTSDWTGEGSLKVDHTMALTASLGAPGSAGRAAYPANDVMASAGGDALAPPAGLAAWDAVPDRAMRGIVIPAAARMTTARTRKRPLMPNQPVCVRSSCMSTCHSCGHAALVQGGD